MLLQAWANPTYGLYATAVSLLVGLLAVTWKLGAVANGMNKAADNAAKLSGQLQTLTSTIDMQKAGSVPDNIDQIARDMDDITESMHQINDVDDSVNNIEAAITAVDLPGIQNAIERLFTDQFDESGLPTGNSVIHTLEESGVEVAISLGGVAHGVSRVQIRFEEDVQVGSIVEQLEGDDDLVEFEQEVFGAEPNLTSPSPRQINFDVPSTDVDEIADWISELIEKLDEYVVKTTVTEKRFDEAVEDSLRETDYI